MSQRTRNQTQSTTRHAKWVTPKLFFQFKVVALFSIFLLFHGAAFSQELIIQADRWCPYNCEPGTTEPGYAVEIMQAIFEPSGTKIKYEIVPWDRAIMQANDGTASAAIAAVKLQADKNGLLVGSESIGTSHDCLFVAANSPIRFSKADDLNALRSVAIVSGYDYSQDLGVWLTRAENKGKIVIQSGAKPAEINARNLAMGRLDGVIENGHVMQNTIFKLGLANKVISAGCQKEVPIYMAFSPHLENVQQVMKKFDDGIERLRRSRQLAKILDKYGLSDWK